MKIRIQRTCILDDGITAVAGQVFEDFPAQKAMILMLDGKAEEYKPMTQPLPLPEAIEVREPVAMHRDPAPRNETRRSKRRMP
jgi:hypothetical protein